MTTNRAPLVERIRRMLTTDSSTREVPMFGGLSFMVNDKMVVAVQNTGCLLVRVDPARNDELGGRTGATPAEMGAGRAMGPGWIQVSEEALAADADLSFWIGVALEYSARVGKGPR